MKSFGATININTTQGVVWKVLVDAERYPEWDPGTDRIEGTIGYGEEIRVFTKENPKRAFPVKVTEFKPGQKMTWSGGLPGGIFTGVRTFTLRPTANGSIDFTLKEEFDGILFPLLGWTVPNLTATFEAFAAGLKTRAEQAG